MEKLSHGLRLGVEVDYLAVPPSYWIPARVERVERDFVSLRFNIGGIDITHTLDLSRISHRALLAGIGMRSCPLLQGQQVDFLRRQAAAGLLGPSQQWQRCEIVTSHEALKTAGVSENTNSYGGVQKVLVKLVSSGSKIMGVNYAPSDVHYSDAPSTSIRDGGKCKVPVGWMIGPEHVICSPGCLAPGGTFASWVPSALDIQPVAPGDLEENVVSLGRRAHGSFAAAAETTARLMLGGRGALIDFDLVDILPRTWRSACRNRKRAEETLADALSKLHLKPISEDDIPFQLHQRDYAATEMEEEEDLDSRTNQPHLWYLGRIKCENYQHPITGVRSHEPIVYWFEPGLCNAGTQVTQVLRRAPVREVYSIAPPGTYTLSWIVGSRVDSRRLGGLWAPSEIVYVDRYVMKIAVKRPAADKDRNAEKPTEAPAFAKGSSKMRKRKDKRPSTDGFRSMHTESYCISVHHGVLSSVRKRASVALKDRKYSTTAALLDGIVEDLEMDDDPASHPGVPRGKHIEVIPQAQWKSLIARPGHFCPLEADARSSIPMAAPRKGTMLFKSAEKQERLRTASAAVAAAAKGFETGAIVLPPATAKKLRTKSAVERFIGR